MSLRGSIVGSQATQGRAAAHPPTATQPMPPKPPLEKAAMLLQKLDDLLLLNGAEPYREIWSELKMEIGKLHVPPQVTVDNALVQKLTEAVADLVNKQNQA